MQILGIDPSCTTGTGVALVTPGHLPHIVTCDCFLYRVPQGQGSAGYRDPVVAEAWITARVLDFARKASPNTPVSIEWPPDGYLTYQTKKGKRNKRIVTSATQWRLIGRICEALKDYRMVYVTPADAKRAVGLKGNDSRKPVLEVERFCNVRLEGFKYRREAIADAVAIALAGDAKLKIRALED